MNTRTIKIEDTPELRINPNIEGVHSGNRVILGETRTGMTTIYTPERQAEYKAAFQLTEAEYAQIKKQPK
jgi:hypothetical protein